MTKHIPLWDYQQDESEDTIYISYMGTNVAQTEKPKIAIRLVRYANSHEALVKALEEAQQYILSCKRKKQSEFNIKNSDYFHIAVVMTEALKLAGEED